MEEMSFPLGYNMVLLACASVVGGSHKPVVDHKGAWSCRFTNGLTSSRFVFFRVDEDFVYEVYFVKRSPSLYRLIGKFKNMVAPMETWNVTLDTNPPITVSKRVRDMKPVLEISTPRSSVVMNREEIFATLVWYSNLRVAAHDNVSNGAGAFVPSNSKSRKLVFGISGEKEQPAEAFKVYGALYKDENVFRQVLGLLNLAVFVV